MRPEPIMTFSRGHWGAAAVRENPRILRRSQRFLKPRRIAMKPAGATEMAGATKKRDARKTLTQPGWITLDGGFAARQCVVQDMSASGAKISVEDSNALPATLRL